METKHNNIEIENKDPVLWKLAQKRAGFKYHLLSYCIMNIFFWTIWYINHGNNFYSADGSVLPWPAWPTFFWGIGVFFNYLGAYKSNNQLAEKEYQKLTYKQQ